MLQLKFNPGLTLTAFRTTRPRLAPSPYDYVEIEKNNNLCQSRSLYMHGH